jgi:hypothetical protein
MKKSVPLALLLLPLGLLAQFHDNTTLLGYYGGWITPPNDKYGITMLTFPDGSLHMEENEELTMYFDMTNAIISDSSGSLQMYSNGIWIGHPQWDTLENGAELTDDGPLTNIWPQLALALPQPGHSGRYVLLYGDEEMYWPFGPFGDLWITSGGLFAAEVDMTLNGGLGKVISRGQAVVEDTLSMGKFTACKHANGRDWWILAHENYTNRYYRMLLDPDGVHLVGLQTIGTPYQDGVGQACFSPNGEKYVVIDVVDFDTATVVGCTINVYDFDRCTGLLSNHV